MATHTNLPIYKAAYNLLDVVMDLVKNMPRDFKRTLGEKVLVECIDVSILIFRANVAEAQARAAHIQQILERNQVIELMLRLAVDKRLISTGQYARSIEITDQLGRQATGWKKYAVASPAV